MLYLDDITELQRSYKNKSHFCHFQVVSVTGSYSYHIIVSCSEF